MIARGGMGQTEWRRSAVSLDLEARKGHRFLLEAAASLKAQGFKLQYQLAGDGPLRTELENHAVRLGLT